MKKYQIIYADPPWYYPPRRNTKTKFGKGVDSHYSLMTDDEVWMLSTKIKEISSKSCGLCLWVTCPKLDVGVETIRRWGFRYCTILFVWIKENPKSGGFFSGPGHYTKSNAELCLLGVRGSMKVVDRTVKQVMVLPRGKHSQKPDEARLRIEKLFGNLSRIELFARKKVEGWDVWGNEVESSVEI